MPFKMMGKSPLMKKLVGNQSRLPEHLKAKIEAAPESPAKLKKASPAKNTEEDLKKKYPNLIDSEGNVITSPKQQELIDRRKRQEEGVRKKNKRLFDEQEIENNNFDKDLDFEKNKTQEKTQDKTQEIAQVKQKETKIGTGKPLVFGRTNKFGSDSINAGRDAMSLAGSTSTVAENLKNNVTDKVQVGSGSTKRLPIDAVQDRLTKNIDRRTRKSDVRKQTRTAKQSLRQEGSTRKEARDKVGKLGINPNTGKSFDNSKQKQDFINAKGKDTFVSDLQKKIGKTMKKSGVDLSSSNKKETGSTSKVPKIDAFGNEGFFGGQSFGINSKTNPKKKVLSPESKKIASEPLGKPIKKPEVPNIKTVPVAKRPAFYDDGYKNESTRSKSDVKKELKKVKKDTSRGERKSTTLTAESEKAGKPVTVRERLKELRKEKRESPRTMKTKTPSKMMKKSPNKMMKKAAAPKMMKKAPAKMMKKKKK